MVTREEFWQIIFNYGLRILPFQYIFYLTALFLVLWILIKPGRLQNNLCRIFLSMCFAWNAVFFYVLSAGGLSGNSSANIVFAALFILVAALFLLDVFKQKMEFSLPTGRQQTSVLILGALIFCYPLFGFILGHPFAGLIMPGTFPCPTTALALLMLTISLPRVDMVIFCILLLCAIPFTPFIQIARYGVYEDVILLSTGIYSLVLLIRARRSL
ncbi:MAG: hypothetical protein JXA25_07180 [Anaerolineales bacterium]|nr:hypothetical protein [Anaerolineales bacterium]